MDVISEYLNHFIRVHSLSFSGTLLPAAFLFATFIGGSGRSFNRLKVIIIELIKILCITCSALLLSLSHYVSVCVSRDDNRAFSPLALSLSVYFSSFFPPHTKYEKCFHTLKI
jgi:hypothetical protein